MADAPRLFLITPPLAQAEAFAPLLHAALEAADVASLLLRSAAPDEPSLKALVKSLAPIAQARDVAVLIEDARLAARLEVDGAHIAGDGARLDDALASLHPRKIVGAGGLADRDAAMGAGERGADYVMFGGPGSRADHDAICAETAWWAEIFNVPCVGYAHAPERAEDIAAAGAEFVALCEGLWDAPDGVGATLARVCRHLSESRTEVPA